MPVTSSGIITLDDLHVEAGGTTGTECSFNDSDIRDMIGKGSGAQASMSEYYGASSTIWTHTDLPIYGTWRSAYGSGYGDDRNFNASNYSWGMRGQQSTTTTSILLSGKMIDLTSSGAVDLSLAYDVTMEAQTHTGGYLRLWFKSNDVNSPGETGGVNTTPGGLIQGSNVLSIASISGGSHGASQRFTGTHNFTTSLPSGYYWQIGLYLQCNAPSNNPPAFNSYWADVTTHSMTLEEQ